MKTLLLFSSAALLVFPLKAVDSSIRIVFVKDGQIYVLDDGAPREVTTSTSVKRLPVWSQDGSKIAYMQNLSGSSDLGEVAVMTAGGTAQASVPVRTSTLTAAGMRFVESIQWVSNSRIAVSGSINPSTVETVILDIQAKTTVGDIYDDDGGAVFSPDGRHVAFSTGSPHFAPEETRRPQLHVDGKVVFPKPGVHVKFLTRTEWSERGTYLGTVAKDFDTGVVSVVLWSTDGKASQVKLYANNTEGFHSFWNHGIFFVNIGDSIHAFADDRELSIPLDEARSSYKTAGFELQREKTIEIEALGGRDVDIWCSSCPISLLPRGEGPGVHGEER